MNPFNMSGALKLVHTIMLIIFLIMYITFKVLDYALRNISIKTKIICFGIIVASIYLLA